MENDKSKFTSFAAQNNLLYHFVDIHTTRSAKIMWASSLYVTEPTLYRGTYHSGEFFSTKREAQALCCKFFNTKHAVGKLTDIERLQQKVLALLVRVEEIEKVLQENGHKKE